MKTDKEMEEILHCALTQKTEPDAKLQRKVLGMWKEKNTMKANKKWSVAAVTAMCVLAVGVPVGAAVHYLNAGQVAENLNYGKMAEAFNSKDAIEINQTQTVGGYNVTLLGVTSGKGLEKTEWNPECESDGTYLVVSIEKEDGTPMPDPRRDDSAQVFTVEPFIKGYSPLVVNPLYAEDSFGGTWKVIDGVQYQLYGVSNLECFADHSMYVCVTDDIVYNTDMYCYDEKTNEITRNESYEGVNALFEIQLDASKADPKKAEEFLKQFEEFTSRNDSVAYQADDPDDLPDGIIHYDPVNDTSQAYEDFVKGGEWKEKIKNSELKVGPVEVKKDEKADCPYKLPYEIQNETGSGCGGILYFYETDFIDGIAVQISYYGGTGDSYEQISVAEKTDDDTITIKSYERKLTKKEADKLFFEEVDAGQNE